MKSTDKTVFVRFVGDGDASITRFHLEEHFGNYGPIKKCSLIHKKNNAQHESLGYGFVKYVTQEDAERAVQQHNNKYMTVNGKQYKLIVELASTTKKGKNEKTQDNNKNNNHNEEEKTTTSVQQQQQQQPEDDYLLQAKRRKRTSRVIVRNLAFSASETHIRKVLENEFGPIVEVELPRVSPKMHRGFCFVTFQNMQDAQRAILPRINPILIKKRPVAIDLSIPKILHQRIIQQKEQQQEQHVEETKDDNLQAEEKHSHEKDNDEESDSEDDNDRSSDDDQEDSEEDDSEDDSDKDDKDSEKAEKETTTVTTDDKQEKNEHVDDAVSKHCTLFLRNLPFDATRHDVFELFVKFGYITSIYLVKDKVTGVASRSGTAFVSYTKPTSAQRALAAASSGEQQHYGAFVTQRDGNNDASSSSGLYLRGRRILVDLAVDKDTATKLKAEKQQEQTRGKDRRNLYLKTEGRVANQADMSGDNNKNNSAWEQLPESDQLKRQRAFADKNTKLQSPLFFINPHRLSIRNLAKHVDEASLKRLCVMAVTRALKQQNNLVTQDDQVAHWRAASDGGDMLLSTRDIMQRIHKAKEEYGNNSVIPDFDEGNVKQFIPSVFIDRDMTTTSHKKKDKKAAPSRGFGFVEFQHHVHALACLRELNNNPFYSAEYVTGGKKATDMKKSSSKNRKKSGGGEPKSNEFVGDDGRVRIPRLIVEFTVENKAKAKKQAEHRAQQQANAEKQRLEHKEKKQQEEKGGKKKQKKSRGAVQRERKRQQQVESAETAVDETAQRAVTHKHTRDQSVDIGHPQKRVKSVKPPKKKRKVDKEEQNFEKMVQSYKAAFAGVSGRTREAPSTVQQKPNRAEATKKRWFE